MAERTLDSDVVVVGARCAGAATAMLLAAAGHHVVMLDRSALPSDTLSTHGIARGGVVQLARWGLLGPLLATGATASRQVTFGLAGEQGTRPIKHAAGVDLLVGPRRYVLDGLLADAAVAAGATLRDRTQVNGLLHDGRRVAGLQARDRDGELTVRARYVVGADGMRSTVARLVRAGTVDCFGSEAAAFYAYVDDVDWTGFEFHVAEQAFAGVFPCHGRQACVWLLRPLKLLEPVARAGRHRAAALVEQIANVAPDLARRVRAGQILAPVRGAARLPNYAREAHGPGWALVGDAGYHRDPITGHGITDAFRDAELLAAALDHALHDAASAGVELAAYQAMRDAASERVFRLTEQLVAFPPLARFAELQRELAEALDDEAAELASRPAPAGITTAIAV